MLSNASILKPPVGVGKHLAPYLDGLNPAHLQIIDPRGSIRVLSQCRVGPAGGEDDGDDGQAAAEEAAAAGKGTPKEEGAAS